jgi:tetratricopeptide (TPR) repeat protein
MKHKKKHEPAPATSELPGTARHLWQGLGNGWKVAGICAFLAGIVWLVFGRTCGFEFINYDDNSYVYSNAAVTQGMTLKGVAAAFSCQATDNWVPLTTLSHMLDCQFYGLNAGGHHLTNVLLHMATAILLFLVLARMTGTVWRSALVAAVFAIHPLRVESVAWVSERKDVLSGLFFMLTLGAYVRYVRKPRKLIGYLMVLFLFALGLMSKPVLVTLPVVLLLLDYWPLNRFATAAPLTAKTGLADWWGNLSNTARLVLEKIPLLALSLASCIPTVLAEKPGIQTVATFPLPLRIENALVSCLIYIGQMFYPARLAVFYPYPANGLPVWEVAGALIALAAISLAVWFWRREHPYLLTGWLWYLVILIPVIGLIQVGGQARADRHTYLSQIGLYVMLVWLAADLADRVRYRVWVPASCAILVLGLLTWRARAQTAYWINTETLQAHTLDCTIDNPVAHNCLGLNLYDKGRVDEAIVQYQDALRISPRYDDAHDNLGNALLQKGEVGKAISEYQEALSINPGLAGAHYNLGNALRQQGRVEEAISEYQAALKLDPGMVNAWNNLGLALAQNGQVDDAIQQYRKALEIDPRNADACDNLGDALAQTGQAEPAAAEFQEALKLDPKNVEAHNNLGNLLGQAGRVDEAVSQYQAALKLDPDYANAHLGLGTVLLQKGQLNEAILQYLDALKLQPQNEIFQNTFARLVWVVATSPDPAMRKGINSVEFLQNASRLAGDDNPVILRVLAAAYAENGNFSGAMETAERALGLAVAQQKSALAEALQQEMNLYQSGSPIRNAEPMNMAEWQ